MSLESRKVVKFQRRNDSSAAEHCCVPQCTASAKFNSVLSFHTFPKDEVIKQKWLINIRRDNFAITNHTRVCSRHFPSADLIEPLHPDGRRLLRSGAVPVLFQWNNYTLPAPRPDTDTDRCNDVPMPIVYQDHDYCSTADPAALHQALKHIESLRAERNRLRRQLEDQTVNQRFGLERFAASDDDIRFYTRFATHSHFMAFWRLIEPTTHQMLRVTRAQAQEQESASLQPVDEFFLFMTHLSLGLLQRDLANVFRVQHPTVSGIITAWANVLYSVLGSVGVWMPEEAVKARLPKVFSDHPDTQVVLDCIDLRCQTPNILSRSDEVSTFKSHCAFKGLIGMAPHGAVTFVSALYTGSISNKEILRQSGIMSLLGPSAAIMLGEGFLVDDSVPCRVHRVLSKRVQKVTPELRETQATARLRLHVRQLVQRVKEYQLLDTVIPLAFTASINQLYTVACLLINFQDGPLVTARAKED